MLSFLLHADDRIFCLINSHHTPFFDWLFSTITWLGNGWVIAPLLLFIAFIKIPKRNLAVFITVATIGIVGSSLTNSYIKDQTQRPRPLLHFATKSPDSSLSCRTGYTVHIVGPKLFQRSFPSGHSNTAFCAAALVAFMFGNWFWLAFFPAILVAYSRVYMGVHFPLDTLGGAIVGIVFMVLTLFIYNLLVRRTHDSK